jgi:hypothetical protein
MKHGTKLYKLSYLPPICTSVCFKTFAFVSDAPTMLLISVC